MLREPADDGQQLRGQEFAQCGGGLVVRDRRADQGEDGVAASVAVDELKVCADKGRSEVVKRERRQILEQAEKPVGQACCGGEQPFFSAEVVDDQSRVHVRRGGDV